MQITKINRKKEDGTYEATLVLSDEQIKFLTNFALGILINNGLAEIVEAEQSADEVEGGSLEEPISPEKYN